VSAVFDYDSHRFAIGAASSGSHWHAVDVVSLAPTMARVLGAAQQEGRKSVGVETFSTCGVPVQVLRALGPFTYDSPWLTQVRCERCSWVVALDRGTVEQEIELHVGAAGDDPRGELLRLIFTAILADAPPGPVGVAGHRTDLLAHAALHRPTLMVCQRCAHGGCRAAHGAAVTVCPQRVVLCRACSFLAGPWAREREGVPTGECVVGSPCSTLLALAEHYDIATSGLQGWS
jgi:hypothetical protein